MHASLRPIGAALALFLVVPGCGETPSPADSIQGPAFAATGRQILMLDQCEPESFDAAIGPGTCVRNGGITFDKFVRQLEKNQRAASWIFTPTTIHVAHEATLPIVNKGGEVHTFTPVEEFGGGIVPFLNGLTGTPDPAPECLALAPQDFIPAGGQTTHTFEPGASEKFMCCIHPWMRAETK